MKIYTRTGDSGETSLADGRRCEKDNLRIEAYGTADELNSFIGLVLSRHPESDTRLVLSELQPSLFRVGALLAAAKDEENSLVVTEEDVYWLEEKIDTFIAELPELNSFILPGGSEEAALFHVLRTVCRRFERVVTALSRFEKVETDVLKWINRLSDLFFVMARIENHRKSFSEPVWP